MSFCRLTGSGLYGTLPPPKALDIVFSPGSFKTHSAGPQPPGIIFRINSSPRNSDSEPVRGPRPNLELESPAAAAGRRAAAGNLPAAGAASENRQSVLVLGPSAALGKVTALASKLGGSVAIMTLLNFKLAIESLAR